MNIIKTSLALAIAATALTGCGGGGGSDTNAKSNVDTSSSYTYDYKSNARLNADPTDQVDITKVFTASVGLNSIELTTLNGRLDEDSAYLLSNLNNQELYDCAYQIDTIERTFSDMFQGITPDANVYGLVFIPSKGEPQLTYGGKDYGQLDSGDELEVVTVKISPWDVDWSGQIKLHQNLGMAYLILNTNHNTCTIEMKSWDATSDSIL